MPSNMTYILYKYHSGSKVYLSTTGKWIKTARFAAIYSKEEALLEATKLCCCYRAYMFRN